MKIAHVRERPTPGKCMVDAELFGDGLKGVRAAIEHVRRSGGGVVIAPNLSRHILKKVKLPPNVIIKRSRPIQEE